MKSFRDVLQTAEPKTGIPIMVNDFDQWGKDICEYAEVVWPELATWALVDTATKLYLDMGSRSPIEQKMFLALKRKYIKYLNQYPNTTALLLDKKLSEISHFLSGHG